MPERMPDCLRCAHFGITAQPAFPRRCRLYGIAGKNLPAVEVLKATGKHCFSFQPRSR
ncbi:MAG: hypothetical protein LBR16_05095 [Treponema sp.]|jgi:hypothetical protein|nr:hypothetical protein [Treponema sp.]